MNHLSRPGCPWPSALLEAIYTRWPELNNGNDPVSQISWEMSTRSISQVPSSKSLSTNRYSFPFEFWEVRDFLPEECRIDDIGCLCAVLGGINNALRGVYYASPKENWYEPFIDYWLILGRPGMMKTYLERLIRAPFDNFYKAINEEFTTRYGGAKILKERIKSCQQEADRYRKKLTSKLETPTPEEIQKIFLQVEEYKAKLISGFADAVPPRLLWQSGTPKGLSEALSEQNGCLGVITSEESFITENLLTGKPDQELFLRCWDQGDYNRTVKNNITAVHKPTLPMLMIV